MLKTTDLDAAVDADILTRNQADKLLDFARQRRANFTVRTHEDERFRFLKGFNDVFLTTGVVLIAIALMFMQRAGGFAGVPIGIIACGVIWGLSIILVARHKAVLPGIALASAFAFYASIAGCQLYEAFAFSGPGRTAINDSFLAGLVLASAASVLYFWYFRLPFALLLIAGTAAAAVMVAVAISMGYTSYPKAPNHNDIVNTTMTLALMCGLGIFGAAMWFDTSDPERLTRRADCGFWLHLTAAPLIVHPLIAQLGKTEAGSATGYSIAVFVIVSVLAVVALVIDRRAILVAALSYLIAALTYLLNTGTPFGVTSYFIPLGLVGTFVLVLGLWWRDLRARILTPFMRNPLVRRLPPLT
jgi:hypothetical protein